MKPSSPRSRHGASRSDTRRSAAPRQIRIIGGDWKRSILPVLDHEGLRPTPDRVRETLFNWLNHLLDGRWNTARCLDLFAGSGALGMEAASRGATAVTMVENHPAVVRQLEAGKERLQAEQVQVVRADALGFLQRCASTSPAAGFDLIFLDPPYRHDWVPKLLPHCRNALAPGGYVYAEAEFSLSDAADAPWLQGWRIVRADRAGMVCYHLLQHDGT